MSFADEPALVESAVAFITQYWPRYLMEGESSKDAADRLPTDFAEYQLMFLDEADQVAAVGLTIPVSVPAGDGFTGGDGWDAAVERGCSDIDSGREPRSLIALSATVRPDLRRGGTGQTFIEAAKAMGRERGLDALLAPVRPAGKQRYPLLPMAAYLDMRTEDGSRYDAWVRSHEQLGATVLHIAEQSMIVREPLATWSEWTSLVFPVSGSYVIESGLVPLEVDVELDVGTYTEPNVWVRHDL